MTTGKRAIRHQIGRVEPSDKSRVRVATDAEAEFPDADKGTASDRTFVMTRDEKGVWQYDSPNSADESEKAPLSAAKNSLNIREQITPSLSHFFRKISAWIWMHLGRSDEL